MTLAQIRSLNPGTQNIKAHETYVDCFYQTISDPKDERLLHLTTFGSDARQSQPKSSQTLQFDENAARELAIVFAQTWNWTGFDAE